MTTLHDMNLIAFAAVSQTSGCVEWSGCLYDNGYGMRRVKIPGSNSSKLWRAHRYSWTRVFGPVPQGMLVCHTCDNRKCVNVMHLFLGTHKENTDDMVRKGRQSFGNRHLFRGAKLLALSLLLLASGCVVHDRHAEILEVSADCGHHDGGVTAPDSAPVELYVEAGHDADNWADPPTSCFDCPVGQIGECAILCTNIGGYIAGDGNPYQCCHW